MCIWLICDRWLSCSACAPQAPRSQVFTSLAATCPHTAGTPRTNSHRLGKPTEHPSWPQHPAPNPNEIPPFQRNSETTRMFGILKFQTFLLVVLLFICACTYIHGVFPAWLDRNKSGYCPQLPQSTQAKLVSWLIRVQNLDPWVLSGAQHG